MVKKKERPKPEKRVEKTPRTPRKQVKGKRTRPGVGEHEEEE
jgi:hypothetical protein